MCFFQNSEVKNQINGQKFTTEWTNQKSISSIKK
jgi:hypothetical protein